MFSFENVLESYHTRIHPEIFLFLYPHLLYTMGDFILETVEKEHNRMALNVAALAGDILLASGAEIFRVEETINPVSYTHLTLPTN